MTRKTIKFLSFIFVFPILALTFPSLSPRAAGEKKTFKVLAVGNSFSENAFTHLYQIATDAGYDDIKLGNLYIAGCSLQTHWSNARTNAAAYTYNVNTDGKWVSNPQTRLLAALVSEDWDFIVLQQVSTHSGIESSYEPYLTNLIDYINENKTSEDTKLAWHMTWAYAKDSAHAGFAGYNNDQDVMYGAIINAVKSGVAEKHGEIDFIIPAGTAIQNMRTSFIPDPDFTSDGYHLSQRLGCYAAGLVWFAALTGESISNAKTGLISQTSLDVVKEAVAAAVSSPYEVTSSIYAVNPADDFNPEGYTTLDWRPVPFSYWNATANYNYYTAPDVDLNKRFIASGKKFGKAEIPVGSVISLDAGYQYRAEKWPERGLATTEREPNTNERLVYITEDWWGGFSFVTFNLSKVDGENISYEPELHTQALKIYVPENIKNEFVGVVDPPAVHEKTQKSVTLQFDEGFEYSMDGISWQSWNIFTGLNPGTEYTFYRRAAETESTLASPPSEALIVFTETDGEQPASGGESFVQPEKKKDDKPKLWVYLSATAALAAAAFGVFWYKKTRGGKK
ncbi:MAG: DUF4886 domain-containing protein [Eubacteriales bacterium]